MLQNRAALNDQVPTFYDWLVNMFLVTKISAQQIVMDPSLSQGHLNRNIDHLCITTWMEMEDIRGEFFILGYGSFFSLFSEASYCQISCCEIFFF